VPGVGRLGYHRETGEAARRDPSKEAFMVSIRVIATLALALTLGFAPTAAAQAIGPTCLNFEVEGQLGIGEFEIFALPMGGDQLLLSATGGSAVPFTGAATLRGQFATFTLTTVSPSGPTNLGIIVFAGAVDLETGRGEGTCSTIPTPMGTVVCGTGTRVTYALGICEPSLAREAVRGR
jgi:hypothetical protein